MDNKVLLKNVDLLSKLSEQEVSMMPAVEAPLPSVEQVKQIVTLVKNIIFPDYFNKRQSDETIRSYYIGVHMEELARLLTKQIAHGLQFCEDCEAIKTKQQIYEEAERLTLEFIDALPEIKRLLYTDVQAMFDNDPAAPNYGEVIFCYPVVNTMTHYRIAHKLHQLQVPVIPRIITEQAHSKTGIDIHPGAQIGEYFAIDHGTGVVIGETCIIGNHVTLYQGVTLGAKSFKYDEQGNIHPGPRHRLLQCLHPWSHHHWPPLRHRWQHLGHQRRAALLAHPAVKGRRNIIRWWTRHITQNKYHNQKEHPRICRVLLFLVSTFTFLRS